MDLLDLLHEHWQSVFFATSAASIVFGQAKARDGERSGTAEVMRQVIMLGLLLYASRRLESWLSARLLRILNRLCKFWRARICE